MLIDSQLVLVVDRSRNDGFWFSLILHQLGHTLDNTALLTQTFFTIIQRQQITQLFQEGWDHFDSDVVLDSFAICSVDDVLRDWGHWSTRAWHTSRTGNALCSLAIHTHVFDRLHGYWLQLRHELCAEQAGQQMHEGVVVWSCVVQSSRLSWSGRLRGLTVVHCVILFWGMTKGTNELEFSTFKACCASKIVSSGEHQESLQLGLAN
ncbi:hypothetical protein D9M71_427580 [compost metagenome]